MAVSQNEINKQIGKNIKDVRTRKGLTQLVVGEMLGISDKTVLRHEAGKGLNIEKVCRYAEVLECDPALLLLSFGESVNATIRSLMTTAPEDQAILLKSIELNVELCQRKQAI